MFQFATNVSKGKLYLCSLTVEKKLGDAAFHTFILMTL